MHSKRSRLAEASQVLQLVSIHDRVEESAWVILDDPAVLAQSSKPKQQVASELVFELAGVCVVPGQSLTLDVLLEFEHELSLFQVVLTELGRLSAEVEHDVGVPELFMARDC